MIRVKISKGVFGLKFKQRMSFNKITVLVVIRNWN